MEHNNWTGFKGETWKNEINVRDFIQTNYKEYTGSADFLEKAKGESYETLVRCFVKYVESAAAYRNSVVNK